MLASRSSAETIRSHGARVVLRRVTGPVAREIYLHCAPSAEGVGAGEQAAAVYRAILDVLEAEGGGAGSIVQETLFLRSVRADLAPVRAARARVMGTRGAGGHRPATIEIEQPPLTGTSRLELAVQAILPIGLPVRSLVLEVESDPDRADRNPIVGLRVDLGDESRLYAGGLCGRGGDVHAQTLAMFGVAEDLLLRAGMTLGDVVRTWIHLRHIDRDYAGLNRARRAFFEARGLDPLPASTGIGGGPAATACDVSLAFHALRSTPAPGRDVMRAPTLNEAPQYGADFARGMRVVEANKVALHVSGTASIDEAGRTAHPGDLDAQVDRMLLNVSALLAGQGADFGHVVSAVTYLKHPADAARLRARLHEAGYEGFPHAMVAAPICRPELLCETEALAVLPHAVQSATRGC